MTNTISSEIQTCEEQLRQAMLNSDTHLLEKLLSPTLIFTNHLGHIMTKRDDLAMHQSGNLKIESIQLSDQQIREFDGTTIVSVFAQIEGSFQGHHSEASYRFTRVWRKCPDGDWQLEAGHSTMISELTPSHC